MPAPTNHYPPNPTLLDLVQSYGTGVLSTSRAVLVHVMWTAAQAVVGATSDIRATVTDNGATQVITTGITNPTVARNVIITAGGTAGDIKAVQHTIVGTDIDDNAITEVMPVFTVNTAGDVTGVKCFKTITSISQPAHDGTGATFTYKQGAKLGLPYKLTRNTVRCTYLNQVLEATAATITTSTTALESNGATLNSTLNGTVIDMYIYLP